MLIYREDMLELTRRMTPARSCFNRIAGGYRDDEGYDNGTFNIHFLKLSEKDKEKNLALAKAVLFAETNDRLKAYDFPSRNKQSVQMMRLLYEIKSCELKNDALLDTFYEVISDAYDVDHDYGIYLFHGAYDVPAKGRDKEWLEGSETVFDFIICVVCPVDNDYEPGNTKWGFMYPNFANRCTDDEHIAVFCSEDDEETRMLNAVLGII